MAVKKMYPDETLRELLRTGRARQRMSQADAARLAGTTRGWWGRVERGAVDNVSVDTLLAMLEVAGVRPSHLEREGKHDLAARLTKLELFRNDGNTPESLQDYLARAPADDEIIRALMVTARVVSELHRERDLEHATGPWALTSTTENPSTH